MEHRESLDHSSSEVPLAATAPNKASPKLRASIDVANATPIDSLHNVDTVLQSDVGIYRILRPSAS